jgi:hypothetical protein
LASRIIAGETFFAGISTGSFFWSRIDMVGVATACAILGLSSALTVADARWRKEELLYGASVVASAIARVVRLRQVHRAFAG